MIALQKKGPVNSQPSLFSLKSLCLTAARTVDQRGRGAPATSLLGSARSSPQPLGAGSSTLIDAIATGRSMMHQRERTGLRYLQAVNGSPLQTRTRCRCSDPLGSKAAPGEARVSLSIFLHKRPFMTCCRRQMRWPFTAPTVRLSAPIWYLQPGSVIQYIRFVSPCALPPDKPMSGLFTRCRSFQGHHVYDRGASGIEGQVPKAESRDGNYRMLPHAPITAFLAGVE